MGFVSWLLHRIGLKSPELVGRLSATAAEEIARNAAGQQEVRLVDQETRDGQLIWIFKTMSVGSWLVVKIRDEDGRVVSKQRVGKR